MLWLIIKEVYLLFYIITCCNQDETTRCSSNFTGSDIVYCYTGGTEVARRVRVPNLP